MKNGVEIIENQNAIIRMQSRIIDDLFLLLAQHISAEELDELPEVLKINRAAELKKNLGEG